MLIEALRTSNDTSADTIFSHLQQGTDIATLVEHIRTGSLLLQLHDAATISRGCESSPGDVSEQLQPETSEPEAQQAMIRPGQSIQSPHQELFHLLRVMDETRAMEVVRRIREGYDVMDTLRIAREANPLQQSSLSPSIDRRYEIPHSADFPQSLRIVDNPYLEQIVEDSESSPQECIVARVCPESPRVLCVQYRPTLARLLIRTYGILRHHGGLPLRATTYMFRNYSTRI